MKDYTALVPNGTNSITATLAVSDGATFVITSDRNSTRITDSGTTIMPLSVGSNAITIKVTAQSLVATNTYTLTVTKAADNASDEARLSDLNLPGITLSPAFDEDKFDSTTFTGFVANVPHNRTQTYVDPTVKHSGARFNITAPEDFIKDTPRHDIFLQTGTTTVTIVVTPENGKPEDRKTYTVNITRAAITASNDAKLSGLAPTYGLGTGSPVAVTLSPAFDKDVMSYTALVTNEPSDTDDSDDLNVVATAKDGAVVSITSNNDATVGITPVDDTADDTTDTTGIVDLKVGSNVITVMVTAADALATQTYTLTVTRAAANASDDARLSALMADGTSVNVSDKGTLTAQPDGTPIAAPTTADYTTGVSNGVSSIMISATPNHSGAIVNVVSAGSDATFSHTGGDVVADGMVDLVIGRNNVRVEVTAEDGSTKRNYFLVINRADSNASSDAKLSGLAPTYGLITGSPVAVTLSPAFDKDVMSYTALVSNNIASSDDLNVVATAKDGAVVSITSNNDATVGITSVDDTADDTTDTTGIVDLKVGSNVITVMVTAADNVATQTYELTVTRAAANASDDASLSALMADGTSVNVSGKGTLTAQPDGTPIAAPTTADYTTGVSNGVSSIMISATPNHSGAIVNVVSAGSDATFSHTGGDVVADGMVDLSIGRNNVRVEVTAEDGSTKRNYFLVINRAAATASDNAKLSVLTLSGITFSPAFNANTMTYTADVPVNIADTTIVATAAGAEAVDHASGIAISSDRDDSLGPELQVVSGTDNPAHSTSYSVDLSPGDNVITIVVTAQDYATMKTYTIKVIRGASNNAYLSSLSLTDSMDMDVTLTAGVEAHWNTLNCPEMNDRVGADDQPDNATSPYCAMYDGLDDDAKAVVDQTYEDDPIEGFMSNIGMYYANVATGVDMVSVSAMAADSGATVDGTGDKSLNVGANTVEVMVTAEDGTTMMTYTVMVNRAGSSDASLSSLSLMGSDGMAIDLMPMFASDTTAYTASVSSDVEMATVSAMATDDGAMVDVDGDGSLTVGDNTITVTVTAEDGMTMTYTITVTVVEPMTNEERLLSEHDENGNGTIDAAELSAAIPEYLAGDIPPSDMRILIQLYLQG